MQIEIHDSVSFGPFRLDVRRRVLSRDGKFLPLGVRALEILNVLVGAKGGLVTKDALISKVWNGAIVEENSIQAQISALRKAIGEDGGSQRYILTVPGRGYRFDYARVTRSQTQLRNRPSLAVLPFKNMSVDGEHEYFADGVADDIITALSRVRWLTVIASNSSFTYKSRKIDVDQIGQELGVGYVLEGSLRKAGNRMRIVAHLVDTLTGAHLWSNSFEGKLAEVFELQDQVTACVVGAIAPRLEEAEIERAQRKSTGSLDAYDYFLRGMALVRRETKNGTDEALPLFHKAIEFDPEYATAYGMAAWCYCIRKHHGWVSDASREAAEAERLARLAVEWGQDDAIALTMGGRALVYVVGDLDAGTALFDRALALNSNLAIAWNASGWLKSRLGHPEIALEHLAQAMRLSPLDPLMFNMHAAVAFAHFFAGRYDEASLLAEKILQERPNDGPALRIAAASNALGGRILKAQRTMQKLCEMFPALRISNLNEQTPLHRSEDRARWANAMRIAGLPD
jgi:TolB-like protein/tetratricopeptide (TPR) repeat protein